MAPSPGAMTPPWYFPWSMMSNVTAVPKSMTMDGDPKRVLAAIEFASLSAPIWLGSG